ncbi:Glycine--tRNA ligase [Armadillidium vulgare]|nr:Glycine--tRNA ligase [Armadillidium vulgare]
MNRTHICIKKYIGLLDIKFQFLFNTRFSFHKSLIVYKNGLKSNLGKKELTKKGVICFEELKSDEEQNSFQVQMEILKNKIKNQGDVVRQLKLSSTSSSAIKEAIDVLLQHKMDLEKLSSEFSRSVSLDKSNMNDLIKRRFYFDSAFRVYGGVSGQYDYGPTGSAIMDNILSEWKKHFVVRNGLMMMNGAIITPEAVFKSSGHLDRFTDYVAKDELKQLMKKYDMKSPNTQKEFEDVFELNSMFQIPVSGSGMKNYLKPEHAQGIVLNFKKLLEMNDGKLPLACAQIGLAFRDEISVKNKLLRVREFVLAEIEHFCYPDDKSHPKFSQVSDTKLWLFPVCRQTEGGRPVFVEIGEAVNTGMVGSETLGYYMAQTQRFLMNIGMEPRRVRFRQHPSNKMAHYATDCWDAEVLSSFGWVECAGCADRGTYDLSQHSKMTGRDLSVERVMKTPSEKEILTLTINKKKLRESFGEDSQELIEELNDLSPEEMQRMNEILDQKDGEYTINGLKITREMVPKLEKEKKISSVERVSPCVIEPSFGIGRIFYCLLEHTFRIRDGNEFLDELIEDDVSVWIDKSKKSIGRRYLKMDELSVPLCVTIDEETLNSSPPTVSLRDRDSTEQVRLPITEVLSTVKRTFQGEINMEMYCKKMAYFFMQRGKMNLPEGG